MTARHVSLFTTLVVVIGCTDGGTSHLEGGTTGNGGTAGGLVGGNAGIATTAGNAFTGGNALTAGHASTTIGGSPSTSAGGASDIDTKGGNAGTATATPVTRCTEATTGELVLAHTASASQPNSLVGTTTITAGSSSTFLASDLDLKLCFSVVGSVPLTSVAGMSIDSASISGGTVNYVNLSATTRTLESTVESNRYCIVFDVGSATEARGVSVSGTTAVTYNWRFNEKSVDMGLMFDPRAKNAPELKAVLDGRLAACRVVSP